LVTGVIAVGAGVAVAVSPVNLAVIAAVIAAIWLIAIGRQSIAVFHGSLVVILVGYAFLDKGFAYFGAPPVYVGEITLALAAVATLYSLRHARFSLPLLFVVLFMAWGAVRTLPYVGTYGLLAIRDGVTWEYALFAIAVALTVRQDHLDRIVGLYRRGSLLLVWWMPVATILTLRFAASLPTFPGSPVSFVYYKAGDAGVQLAGVAAFVLLGLYSARDTTSFRQVALWAGWFVSAGLAALSRSAMLAMAATGACFLFVISVPRVFSLAFVSAVFVVMLLTVNPEVDLGLSRNVSVTQLIANLGSITGGDDAQLDASKDWRLSWWTKIYGYTIDGPYLWVGKGFGVNLATDDGFQVDEEQSLRAPHSAHLEILARAGLPGLALWALLQLAFAAAMLRAAAIARRIKEPVWIPLLGWVFVYWLAALVNGSFDVYLGGPQGGIWFWSMIGLGLALTRMVNERAAAVRDETTPRIAERLPRGSARPSADALPPVTRA
jgi:O-antigen ligase